MNRKRKAIILICIAILSVVASSIVLFGQWWKLLIPKTEDVRVFWTVEESEAEHRTVQVGVVNKGNKKVNVIRVELIYLPDETLGLIWIENRTLKSATEGKYGYWCENFHWSVTKGGIEEEFQLEFFNLLLEGRHQEIVRIIVETDKKIYTYSPLRALAGVSSHQYTKPTTIEKK